MASIVVAGVMRMRMIKIMPQSIIKLRTYDIVMRAVEEGVAAGIRRAHKHTDTPSQEGLEEALYFAISNTLCEVLDFDIN